MKRWLALLAALALGVSACGGATAGSAPALTAASPASKQITDVTLAFSFYSPANAPLLLAQAKDYNQQAGLNVKFTPVPGGNGLDAAVGGSAQLVLTAVLRPVAALGQGQPFDMFMAINRGFTEDVIMSKTAYDAAGLTDKSSLKDKMQALANKPVGVISAAGENTQVFQYLFKFGGHTAERAEHSCAGHARGRPRRPEGRFNRRH